MAQPGHPTTIAFKSPLPIPRPSYKDLQQWLAEERRDHGRTHSELARTQRALDKETKQHKNLVISADDAWKRFITAKEIAEKMVEEGMMTEEMVNRIFGDMNQPSMKRKKAAISDLKEENEENDDAEENAKRVKLEEPVSLMFFDT